jgi:hypothetical protein
MNNFDEVSEIRKLMESVSSVVENDDSATTCEGTGSCECGQCSDDESVDESRNSHPPASARLLQMVEDGQVSAHDVMTAALNYMSEDDIADMLHQEFEADQEDDDYSADMHADDFDNRDNHSDDYGSSYFHSNDGHFGY